MPEEAPVAKVAPADEERARVCLVCDVGGSSVKTGLVTEDGRMLAQLRFELDSQGPAGQVLDGLAAALEQTRARLGPAALLGLGMAVPGPFDFQRCAFMIRGLGKLEGLYDLPLLPELRARLPFLAGLPIRFLNDASAFATGELRHGAGRGYGRVLVLTLGTGCGSAFAVDGRLVDEGDGVPPHGYVYDLAYGDLTVDEVVSTRGLLSLWRALGPAGSTGEDAMTVRELAEWARSGHALAAEAFRRFGARMVEALAGPIEAFRPEAVVLGGRIALAFDLFGPAAQLALANLGHLPELLAAECITGSALRGAATAVFEAVDA